MLAGQGDQCVHVGIVEQVISAPESEHPQFRVHRDILRLDHHTLGDARKHGADDPGERDPMSGQHDHRSAVGYCGN